MESSSHAQVEAYLDEAWMTSDRPLLVDEYLGHAIEVDVDAACDGSEVHIGAVMEHLEEAGIHSGDSTCFIPPQTLTDDVVREIEELTERIGLELGICGCYNIQFAIQGEIVRVLEVNPRSSRTVPFVAKSTGVPVARIAARAALGNPHSANRTSRRCGRTVFASRHPCSRSSNYEGWTLRPAQR